MTGLSDSGATRLTVENVGSLRQPISPPNHMKDGHSDDKQSQVKQSQVKQIFDAAQDLSVDRRTELISKLMTVKPGSRLFVGIGTTRLSAQTVFQINMNSKAEFAQVLEAVADKMQEQSLATNLEKSK